jgi:N-acetylneuraminate synthase
MDHSDGDLLNLNHFNLRSPKIGMSSSDVIEYLNTPLIKPVKKGDALNWSNFVKPSILNDDVIEFAKNNLIGLPVRLHDFNSIAKKFPIGCYEFHLSFNEVKSNFQEINYPSGYKYSIHLPDYINPNQLMDPVYGDKNQIYESKKIISSVSEFASKLQDISGSQVPIVGSFSLALNGHADYYQKYSQLFEDYLEKNILIIPQWLPPYAWYFGGSVQLAVMNNLIDMEFIDKYNIKICMDICHLAMGQNLWEFKSIDIMKKLVDNIRHVHLADAAGFDGEGMHFGEGDEVNIHALKMAMQLKCLKIIEVWQGHLNEGAGFSKALSDLHRLFR